MTRARVLFSFGRPTPDTNPYTTLLADHVGRSADVLFFSWATAFRSRYDVFHVQWPESLVRPYRQDAKAPIVRAVKFLLATALLLLNRARGRTLVWTVHNRSPHERGPAAERWFIALFLRLVDHRIYLNAGETDERGRPSSVILHPDYSPVATRGAGTAHPEGLLLFGHLKPYKGVEQLVDLVGASPELGPLLVVGNAADPAYGRALVDRASVFDGVVVEPRLLVQAELDSLISNAALVVLPYAYVYNSGSLLLALTLRTPVLVRASPTSTAIRDEVGADWVSLFDGELTADDLADADSAARRVDRTRGPDLSARGWDECAARHLALYDSLAR